MTPQTSRDLKRLTDICDKSSDSGPNSPSADRNGRDEGRDGADELYGGDDADKLYGEGGNDLVDGADDMTADAVLSGGEGAHDRCLASFGDSPSIDCELFS